MKLFILTLLVFAVSSIWIGQVDSSLSQLIQQYYECNHSSQALNNSFYQSLGLTTMKFDPAMAFIKKIFTDIDSCVSNLCMCVTLQTRIQYDFLFLNQSNFAGLKSVILAFNNKYNNKPYVKSLNDSMQVTYNGPSYPAITQFAMKYEFTTLKTSYYNNLPPSECLQSVNDSVYYDCIWFSKVTNRSVITNPTRSQIDNQMVCYLMKYANCKQAELRRYQAVQTWAWGPRDFKYTGKLPAYLDTITARSKSYKPKLKFGTAYVYINPGDGYTIRTDSYKLGMTQFQVQPLDTSFLCLNSSKLRIDCLIAVYASGNVTFTGFNFTFFPTNGANPLSFNVNPSVYNSPVIYTDSKGTNLFQIISNFALYDFNSNSFYYLYNFQIYVFAPISMLNSATGALINGSNDGTVASGRKRREVRSREECESDCKQAYGQMLASTKNQDNMFAMSLYERCMKECN